jgi:hypothetical protein
MVSFAWGYYGVVIPPKEANDSGISFLVASEDKQNDENWVSIGWILTSSLLPKPSRTRMKASFFFRIFSMPPSEPDNVTFQLLVASGIPMILSCKGPTTDMLPPKTPLTLNIFDFSSRDVEGAKGMGRPGRVLEKSLNIAWTT